MSRGWQRPARLLGVVVLVAAACTSSGGPPNAGPSTPSTSPVGPTLRLTQASFRLPRPVQREVAVERDGIVYLAGGLDATGNSASGVFALHVATGKLASLGTVPTPFHDAAGALVGGRLLVFGGGRTESSDQVQGFDLSTGRGTVTGHLPTPLSDLASATVGNSVYLIGGWNGRTLSSVVYVTTDGHLFKRAGRLPAGLRYPAVTSVGTDLIVAGGITGTGPVSTVYRFDASTGRSSLIGNLPDPVAHAAAFTIGSTAFVAGGKDAKGNAVRTAFAVDGGTIRPMPPLPRPLSDAGVVSDQEEAWLIGGWRGRAVAEIIHVKLLSATPTPIATATATGASTASLAPDPAGVRPFAGLLLIADRGNNRLLVVNPSGHVVWRYPSAQSPPPPVPFYYPDDAFWVHGGHAILVNEEENNVLAEIAYPSGRTLWTYGHPRVGGSTPGYTRQPDDVYPYPGGGMVVADAKNCRILFFSPRGRPTRQIGTTGVCTHDLPRAVGYPNGDTPLPNGHLLLSELNGGWIDEVTSTGHVIWSARVPGLPVPSDPQRLADGTFIAVDYESPGGVVHFTKTGKVLWSFRRTSGPRVLDHPSLAAPFPNGLVAVTDDFHHRVILIDPERGGRIVWQYGSTNVPGTARGLLNIPDGLDLLLPGGVIPLHVDFATARVRPGRP